MVCAMSAILSWPQCVSDKRIVIVDWDSFCQSWCQILLQYGEFEYPLLLNISKIQLGFLTMRVMLHKGAILFRSSFPGVDIKPFTQRCRHKPTVPGKRGYRRVYIYIYTQLWNFILSTTVSLLCFHQKFIALHYCEKVKGKQNFAGKIDLILMRMNDPICSPK